MGVNTLEETGVNTFEGTVLVVTDGGLNGVGVFKEACPMDGCEVVFLF
jgi:hypothetical protein